MALECIDGGKSDEECAREIYFRLPAARRNRILDAMWELAGQVITGGGDPFWADAPVPEKSASDPLPSAETDPGPSRTIASLR